MRPMGARLCGVGGATGDGKKGSRSSRWPSERHLRPVGPSFARPPSSRVRIQQKENSMTTTTDLTIRPFEVHMPDEDLADLQRRIAATRWPSKELVTDRSQGVQLAMI